MTCSVLVIVAELYLSALKILHVQMILQRSIKLLRQKNQALKYFVFTIWIVCVAY